MLIKQMSVFVENTLGRLADLTKVLSDNNIDLMGSTIADTADFGILRCIVAEPEKATELLKAHGYTASITEVIAVSLEDKPGGFYRVLKVLADAQLSIGYTYSTVKCADGEAVIVMKVEDPERATELLKAAGVQLISVEDLK